ncbi:methyltransferase family protein [Larkinella arboricola]|uniref:Methyltransferase family protein n=1 Tax=Larkinella arboricola TaxID=643671 RepID=A0A327X931_LARAB|nr:class I SAM-dependent methyltransferase [Larkinella arboricola]RAK02393.1 methyltransferase family protein [Larkinella arboricola]
MSLKSLIPNPIKTALKNIIPLSVIDQLEIITGERDALTPPSRMIFIGDGDFKKVGELTVSHIKDLVGLNATDRVLDVGSGIGRVAIPLTKYINPPGGYDGIEIVKEGVDWCNKEVHKRFPHFNFHHLNVYNKMYNPKGTMQGHELRFPFESLTFDLVILNSVFTHMLEADFERYLAEISRVLKKGARGYITMFLLNEESRRLNAQGKNKYERHLTPFTDKTMVYLQDLPESMIAFDETYAREAFAKAGLTIQNVQFGNWCGRENTVDYQDLLSVSKI